MQLQWVQVPGFIPPSQAPPNDVPMGVKAEKGFAKLVGGISNMANNKNTEKCASCSKKQTVTSKIEFFQCYNCKLVNPTAYYIMAFTPQQGVEEIKEGVGKYLDQAKNTVSGKGLIACQFCQKTNVIDQVSKIWYCHSCKQLNDYRGQETPFIKKK